MNINQQELCFLAMNYIEVKNVTKGSPKYSFSYKAHNINEIFSEAQDISPSMHYLYMYKKFTCKGQL